MMMIDMVKMTNVSISMTLTTICSERSKGKRKKQRKQFMVLNDVHIHHFCLSEAPCCMYVGGTEDPWNLISQYFQDSDLIFAEQCLHGFVTDVQEDSTGSHLIFAHIVWLHGYTGGDQVDWDNLSSDLVLWLFLYLSVRSILCDFITGA